MVDVKPEQRNVLILGALMGAILGAGVAWMLVNSPAEDANGEERQPIAPGEVLKLTSRVAMLMRDVNNMRLRM